MLPFLLILRIYFYLFTVFFTILHLSGHVSLFSCLFAVFTPLLRNFDVLAHFFPNFATSVLILHKPRFLSVFLHNFANPPYFSVFFFVFASISRKFGIFWQKEFSHFLVNSQFFFSCYIILRLLIYFKHNFTFLFYFYFILQIWLSTSFSLYFLSFKKFINFSEFSISEIN